MQGSHTIRECYLRQNVRTVLCIVVLHVYLCYLQFHIEPIFHLGSLMYTRLHCCCQRTKKIHRSKLLTPPICTGKICKGEWCSWFIGDRLSFMKDLSKFSVTWVKYVTVVMVPTGTGNTWKRWKHFHCWLLNSCIKNDSLKLNNTKSNIYCKLKNIPYFTSVSEIVFKYVDIWCST